MSIADIAGRSTKRALFFLNTLPLFLDTLLEGLSFHCASSAPGPLQWVALVVVALVKALGLTLGWHSWVKRRPSCFRSMWARKTILIGDN